MSNNKITGVGDPASAQDVATKNYIDTSFLALSGGTINGDLTLGATSSLKFLFENAGLVIKAGGNGLLVSAPAIFMTT